MTLSFARWTLGRESGALWRQVSTSWENVSLNFIRVNLGRACHECQKTFECRQNQQIRAVNISRYWWNNSKLGSRGISRGISRDSSRGGMEGRGSRCNSTHSTRAAACRAVYTSTTSTFVAMITYSLAIFLNRVVVFVYQARFVL